MADIVKDVVKGVDYFRDLKKGKKPQMEKMEEAVEGSPGPPPEGRGGVPLTDEQRKERHKSLYGTEELPPRGTGRLMRRSTEGSPPFTDAELKKGYRKL